MQLPPGVIPQISPESPTGEIFRYMLINPKDSQGRPIYSLNDLKSLQDWTLERLFRRVPRIDRRGQLRRHGQTLRNPARSATACSATASRWRSCKNAITTSNANVGGEYVFKGETVQVVRSLGLIGEGEDPMDHAMAMTDPVAARDYLRARRGSGACGEIRQIVLAATNNVPIRVDDVVEGGPVGTGRRCAAPGRGRRSPDPPGPGHDQPTRRRTPAARDLRRPAGNRVWDEETTWSRASCCCARAKSRCRPCADVEALIEELNETPGRLLPGVKIDTLLRPHAN